MIRKMKQEELNEVMNIWLETNIKAHNFIPQKYWEDNFELVKKLISQAKIYIYEKNKNILGFIGMSSNYIAGIFVKEEEQSKGIGKELLNFIKDIKKELNLNVYEKNIKAVNFYKRENFYIINEGIDEAAGEKEFFMEWKK